jgi:hypothetical protein
MSSFHSQMIVSSRSSLSWILTDLSLIMMFVTCFCLSKGFEELSILRFKNDLWNINLSRLYYFLGRGIHFAMIAFLIWSRLDTSHRH